MLHFILGRINSGKTSYIRKLIGKSRNKGNLLIVPEQFSHTFERELCEICGNSVSLYTEVTNFRRLATKIKSELGGLSADILSDSERILYLHSAARDVMPLLTSLLKTAQNTERLDALLATVDRFKTYGITPEMLSQVTDDLSGSLKKKISDIALIYAAYENRLDENTFDAYSELSFVADALRRSRFFEGKCVYFDSFLGFTHPQYEIIEAAIKSARDVFIALELPENAESGMENGIFDAPLLTKKRLSDIAERNNISTEEIYMESSTTGEISHLDLALYANEVRVYENDAKITVASASSVFEECEKAAAHIIKSVSDGARFRDFSVSVCSDEYLPVCESVFLRYGIPCYTGMPAPLSSNPVISLIETALECAYRGLRTELIMNYIKTGFAGISSKSLNIFENYLYTWSPKKYEWESKKPFSRNPFGISAPETDESREALRIINRVREKVCAPLKNLANKTNAAASSEALATALYDFINEINLPRRIEAASYLSERSERFDEALEYQSVLSILYEIIDTLGRQSPDSLSAEDLYFLFKLSVSQHELTIIPPTIDCVNIASLDRADGEKCHRRIILGANDGALAAKNSNFGILTENDVNELLDYGIEISNGLYEQIFEECRLIHHALSSPSDELYVSYLTVSSQGDEMYESREISRILEIFPKRCSEMTVSEARSFAKIPYFDESVSKGFSNGLWDNDVHFSERLSAIRQNIINPRGPILKRENIEASFGKRNISLSATKTDLFSSCRYAYFLKFGLRAEARVRGEISPLETGTLMHYVLEKVLPRLSENSGYSDTNLITRYSREAVREYVSDHLSGAGELSGRFEFLLKNIENSVIAAVCDICREIEKSSFKPTDFELSFIPDGDLPPIKFTGDGYSVSFSGKIDRVDTYSSGGKLYLRLIDYKSGPKDFNLNETINGIGMQLILYMLALEELGEERYGSLPYSAGAMYVPLIRSFSDTVGKPASPAKRRGVFLFDEDIINAMEHGDTKEFLPLTRLKDGGFRKSTSLLEKKQLDTLKERMREILLNIGKDLSCGEISPNPYRNSGSSACDFCDYRNICAFDEERGGDTYRPLFELRADELFTDDEESKEVGQ